jgi:hypothetical protein
MIRVFAIPATINGEFLHLLGSILLGLIILLPYENIRPDVVKPFQADRSGSDFI